MNDLDKRTRKTIEQYRSIIRDCESEIQMIQSFCEHSTVEKEYSQHTGRTAFHCLVCNKAWMEDGKWI